MGLIATCLQPRPYAEQGSDKFSLWSHSQRAEEQLIFHGVRVSFRRRRGGASTQERALAKRRVGEAAASTRNSGRCAFPHALTAQIVPPSFLRWCSTRLTT